ncbi:hypothetical protein N3K66_001313 [Trichothecium roseum]|uniref:Uncharacterized protein n=1 Tax=Trichothecium roseum TaxID=47278 RepID=A0ACC0VF05_9HYPO|nr:hypothetical protein N3K66_001313 [Trichothecium roseum]
MYLRSSSVAYHPTTSTRTTRNQGFSFFSDISTILHERETAQSGTPYAFEPGIRILHSVAIDAGSRSTWISSFVTTCCN